VSSPHPSKIGSLPNPATTTTATTATVTAAAATTAAIPRFSTRPVHPFSLSCAFDRQRGQFIVQAGARAGACAVVTAAVLALGTFSFVRSTLLRGGPSTASAAVTPPLASTTKAVAPAKQPGVRLSQKRASSARASKPAKSAKAQSAAVSTPTSTSTPTPAPTIRHHTPAEQRQAERRRAGLNYLVVLNLRTKASAEKAREALLRKGVATTVERHLPGHPPEAKYSLVCLTGFDLDSDRAKLDKQVKRLKALKLDPKPYTWGG
jgi:hypothetical protein